MKMILKWTACAACAVWAGASASAATETVTGQNVIGLTTIKNDSREYLPLAAAYTGTGATELTVANIVQTATLAEGDELYAYDPGQKQYDVYTLGKAGKWTAVKTVEVSASGTATATTSPAAQIEMERLNELRGCEVHMTHIVTPGDEAGLRRLGCRFTSDPYYATNALFNGER